MVIIGEAEAIAETDYSFTLIVGSSSILGDFTVDISVAITSALAINSNNQKLKLNTIEVQRK